MIMKLSKRIRKYLYRKLYLELPNSLKQIYLIVSIMLIGYFGYQDIERILARSIFYETIEYDYVDLNNSYFSNVSEYIKNLDINIQVKSELTNLCDQTVYFARLSSYDTINNNSNNGEDNDYDNENYENDKYCDLELDCI